MDFRLFPVGTLSDVFPTMFHFDMVMEYMADREDFCLNLSVYVRMYNWDFKR